MSTEEIVRLRDLRVGFPEPGGTTTTVLRDVSLTVAPGDRLGLIGASGSGKSLTALAMLDLIPESGIILGGSVAVHGAPVGASRDGRRPVRGGVIGLVFQEAEAALNPVMTIGGHFKEAVARHRPEERSRWKERASEALASVELEPAAVLNNHAHRLSGGQRQRVQLALTLIAEPDLLIADEPTSSLDVLTQANILELLDRLCRGRGCALLLISHDLGVVASLVDRVAVMLRGSIIEEAPTRSFLEEPIHPYSVHLVTGSAATVASATVPDTGCPFADRCAHRIPSCTERFPDLQPAGPDRRHRCPVVGGRP